MTGAGGSGRTTVAAATACAAAAEGQRVLLITAEPAARLRALLTPPPTTGPEGGNPVPDTAPAAGPADAGPATRPGPDAETEADERGTGAAPAPETGATGSDTPGPDGPGPDGPATNGSASDRPGADEPDADGVVAVSAVPGLWLARVDGGEEFRTRAAALQERGKAALDLLGTSPLDGEELTELPGAETFAVLHGLRHARSPRWDTVVIDLPPTPYGLNALVLPEQLRRYLRRLVPPERQAARALRPVLAQLAGAPAPGPWLYEATARWERELAAVQDVVESPHTAVRLVAEPGPLAAESLRAARAGLRLHGLALEAVVANRLLPAGSADPWLAALSGQQQTVLKELRATCETEGVPLCELPHLGRDPRGPEDLVALARAARATASQVPDPQGPARHGWVEDLLDTEGHLAWRLPMPGALRDELELVRRGDELIVGVGPYRRVLPLPSALRRCRVSGAALTGGELRVRFTPDPQLWPRRFG